MRGAGRGECSAGRVRAWRHAKNNGGREVQPAVCVVGSFGYVSKQTKHQSIGMKGACANCNGAPASPAAVEVAPS